MIANSAYADCEYIPSCVRIEDNLELCQAVLLPSEMRENEPKMPTKISLPSHRTLSSGSAHRIAMRLLQWQDP